MMPDQADQGQLLRPGHQIAGGVKVGRGNVAAGHCQHAHGLAGEAGVLGLEGSAGGVVQRRFGGGVEIAVCARQQHIGRALEQHAHPYPSW